MDHSENSCPRLTHSPNVGDEAVSRVTSVFLVLVNLDLISCRAMTTCSGFEARMASREAEGLRRGPVRIAKGTAVGRPHSRFLNMMVR